MSDNFPSQLIQAVALQSSSSSSHDDMHVALVECNRAFEAGSPSALLTSTTPSTSLLSQLAQVLETMLCQDIADTGANEDVTNDKTVQVLDNVDNDYSYSEYLRAAKNVLRWNLIWRSQQQKRTMPTVSILDNNNDQNGNRNPLEALQNFGMLRVYMSHLNASIGIQARQDEARYATLCLLHATYHNPDDASREREQPSPLEFLVQDLSYLRTFCKVMLNTETNRLVQLANLRLLHNLLASLPSFVKELSQYKIFDSDKDVNNIWIPLASINTVLDLLLYHVDVCSRQLESGDETINNDNNRQQELVAELMRILYILRAGKIMIAQVLKRLLLQTETRLLAIMLLADTPTKIVMEMEVESILLDALEAQVSVVVDQMLLGSEAASALTPILMLIHNLCQSHDEFRNATRNRIFPNPVNLSPSTTKSSLDKTTMSPADAPPGSLRYKCIRLLSWTESHSKRWMAELLWILCGANKHEYTYRVGMGNAMPLLHARGLVELPTAMPTTTTRGDHGS